MGSFNYTWNNVRNYTSGFGTGSSFTPNQLINTVGCGDSAPCNLNGQAQYYNWQAKFDNTLQLPYKFQLFSPSCGCSREFRSAAISARPASLSPGSRNPRLL